MVVQLATALLQLGIALPQGMLFGIGYGTDVRIGYEQVYPLLFPQGQRHTATETAKVIGDVNKIYNAIGGKEASQMGIAVGLSNAGKILANPDFQALEESESKSYIRTQLKLAELKAQDRSRYGVSIPQDTSFKDTHEAIHEAERTQNLAPRIIPTTPLPKEQQENYNQFELVYYNKVKDYSISQIQFLLKGTTSQPYQRKILQTLLTQKIRATPQRTPVGTINPAIPKLIISGPQIKEFRIYQKTLGELILPILQLKQIFTKGNMTTATRVQKTRAWNTRVADYYKFLGINRNSRNSQIKSDAQAKYTRRIYKSKF